MMPSIQDRYKWYILLESELVLICLNGSQYPIFGYARTVVLSHKFVNMTDSIARCRSLISIQSKFEALLAEDSCQTQKEMAESLGSVRVEAERC